MLPWLDEIQTNLLPKFLHIPCYFPRFPNRTQKYIFFSAKINKFSIQFHSLLF
ncbi:hypothetical protein Hanom_Chr01g00047781 [Helianthus anomalus]